MQSLAKFRPWVVSFRLAVSGPKICIPNVWMHLRLHHHSNMALLFNVLSFYFAQLVGRMYTLKQSYSRPLISLGGACIYSFSGLLLEVQRIHRVPGQFQVFFAPAHASSATRLVYKDARNSSPPLPFCTDAKTWYNKFVSHKDCVQNLFLGLSLSLSLLAGGK